MDDRDAVRYLKIFTFLDRGTIEQLEQRTAERPELREAQRRLAREMTSLVHGDEECARAIEVSEALFGSGAVGELDPNRLERALESAPTVHLDSGTEPPAYAELLVQTGLARSISDAARLAAGGGVYANDARVADVQARPGPEQFLGGRVLVLRRGRRSHALVVRDAG